MQAQTSTSSLPYAEWYKPSALELLIGYMDEVKDLPGAQVIGCRDHLWKQHHSRMRRGTFYVLWKPKAGKPTLPHEVQKCRNGPWPLCLVEWGRIGAEIQQNLAKFLDKTFQFQDASGWAPLFERPPPADPLKSAAGKAGAKGEGEGQGEGEGGVARNVPLVPESKSTFLHRQARPGSP